MCIIVVQGMMKESYMIIFLDTNGEGDMASQNKNFSEEKKKIGQINYKINK